MTTVLTNHLANFEELAVMCTTTPPPRELRSYIDGLKSIDTSDEGYYGEYARAAEILRKARVEASEKYYVTARASWAKNLVELIEAVAIEGEITGDSGPDILSGLRTMEQAKEEGFDARLFGDLMDDALRVQDEAIVAHRKALSQIALMVLDPALINEDPGMIPTELLEFALENFKALSLTLDVFLGDVQALDRAKALHPQSVKKQEARIARAKERDNGLVNESVERREEIEHRNRVNDAGLTAEQRGAKTARMLDAAQPMYDIIRRITEIAHLDEQKHQGMIDGEGLLEVAHRSHAMVARVEGRMN